MKKKRLDTLVFERGHTISREKAKALILSGKVYVNGEKITKAGEQVSEFAEITIEEPLKYVSRGGFKLEKALNELDINVKDKTCLDIGASTGGFTDCLLQNGAAKVYAVDVGYGQLDWKLRKDKRVIVIERCNFRHIDNDLINEKVDIIVIDVSFISLKLIIPKALKFLKENGIIIPLIKPQFEAGKENVGKGGIVKDPTVHKQVINSLSTFFSQHYLNVVNIIESPILGQKGNKEFLALLKKTESQMHEL